MSTDDQVRAIQEASDEEAAELELALLEQSDNRPKETDPDGDD